MYRPGFFAILFTVFYESGANIQFDVTTNIPSRLSVGLFIIEKEAAADRLFSFDADELVRAVLTSVDVTKRARVARVT